MQSHTSKVSSSGVPTFCDDLLDELADEDYSVMPSAKDETEALELSSL